jgi:uncharacterized protein
MRVDKIEILEDNEKEICKIEEVCNKLVEVDKANYSIDKASQFKNRKHCDAIIYGNIDDNKIIVLLEVTGKHIKREDYEDKMENVENYIKSMDEHKSSKIIRAIHSDKGFGKNMSEHNLKQHVYPIRCNKNKSLCEIVKEVYSETRRNKKS